MHINYIYIDLVILEVLEQNNFKFRKRGSCLASCHEIQVTKISCHWNILQNIIIVSNRTKNGKKEFVNIKSFN